MLEVDTDSDVLKVSELVDRIEERYGGLRKAARALNTTHQRLARLKAGGKRVDDTRELIAKIQRLLKRKAK